MSAGSEKKAIPTAAKIYIAAMIAAGVAGLGYCFAVDRLNFKPQFLLYLVIALACSGLKVVPPGVSGNISVNYVFTVLGLLELTLPDTVLMAVLGTIAQTLWHVRRRPSVVQIAFNTASMVVTVVAASLIYHLPIFSGHAEGQLFRLVLAGIAYFLLNTLSVSVVIALVEQRGFHSIWHDFYIWLFTYYMVGVSLAEMVHLSIERLGWTFTVALVPMLYAIYRSYRLYLSKLQQEKEHAESMASLHLRTIEALAMAIEAKDECTHEHLRRVQVYSLEIAAHLGLDSEQVQALQAASILHDIGKLAVPDYIISKPGKLTPEEFEKMKTHTTVGAAILEQVGFPYQVPGIVRSHHERWDGAGYPDGLKGENIPIGARILTAVDCLDALATDRQYRRAMPLEQAMEYVASLAGKQFDPKVVEVLHAHYKEFERLAQSMPLREHKLDKHMVVTRGDAPAAGFEQTQGTPAASDNGNGSGKRAFVASIASARQEVQTILELTQELSASLRLEETLSMVAERLKHLVPFDCIAVYVREGQVLKPKYVNGENSRMFATLEIPVGQGLSGWVVENDKPIVNGNPSVEPGYLNDPTKFSLLNSALSVPLGEGAEELSGALTLYRAERDSYNRDHLRVLLAITPKISRAVESALRFQRAQQQANTDDLTSLPNARSLCLHLEDELLRCRDVNENVAVLVCDLDGFKHVNDCYGHLAGNELLKSVASVLKANCRDTDYVARMGGDEFVLLLHDAQPENLEARIHTLDRLVRRACGDICGEEHVGISVGIACFPEHGNDPETLLAHADSDMYRAKRARKNVYPLTVVPAKFQVA